MTGPIRISVVVCTHNRSRLLARLLSDLSAQTLPSASHEIIVVDNASQDDTRTVALEFCQARANARYLFEENVGLSNARNCGWRGSAGEYVGYVDDDCRISPRWLETADEIIRERSPAVFGGPLYPVYETPKPRWYNDRYATYSHGDQARVLSTEHLYGANIFFRRSLLEESGGFDPRFGRAGKNRGYGGENGPQLYIRRSRPTELFYYSPALYAHHLVKAREMTLRHRARQQLALGFYVYHLFRTDAGRLPYRTLARRLAATAVRLGLDVLRSPWRDRSKYPYIENYLYEHTSSYLNTLGRLYGNMRGLSRPRSGAA